MSPERRASTSGAPRPDRPRSSRRLVLWLLSAAVLAAAGVVFVVARAWAERRFREDLAVARLRSRTVIRPGAVAAGPARRAAPDEGEVLYWLGYCEAASGRAEAARRPGPGCPPIRPGWPNRPWSTPGPRSHLADSAGPSASSGGRRTGGFRAAQGPAPDRRPDGPAGAGGRGPPVPRGPMGGRAVRRSRRPDRAIRDHIALDLEPFPLEWNLSLLEGNPDPADAEDRRAVSLARSYLARRSGDFEAAGAELRSSLRRWPDDPKVWKSWLDWAVAADRMGAALVALDHLPARLLDEPRILESGEWFARHRGDDAEEIRTLERLLTVAPGRTAALTRLAELRRGALGSIVALRRQESEMDSALDRYNRLYKEGRLVEHLLELANLAERLGRRFEARAFRELIDRRDGRPDAVPVPEKGPRSEPSGTLAQALADVLPPRPWPEPEASVAFASRTRSDPPVRGRGGGGRAGRLHSRQRRLADPSAPGDGQRRRRPDRLRRRRLARRLRRPGRPVPTTAPARRRPAATGSSATAGTGPSRT